MTSFNNTAAHTAETLFLCKMDPNVHGDAKFVAVIGRIVGNDDAGYRFLPNCVGRKGSRKAHSSVNASIPRWTEGLGFLRLLDAREIAAAKDGA